VKWQRLNRAPIFQLLLIALILAGSGCDPQTKHRVLTVFFTGVPPLEEERNTGEKGTAEQSEKAVDGSRSEAVRPARKVTVYAHPFYAGKRCDACHAAEATLGFTPLGNRGSGTIFGGTSAASPARLRLPPKKLCIQCHRHVSSAEVSAKSLWLHSPAAKGDCLACHDPHQSNNRYRLLDKPRTICIPCHKDPKIIELAAHNEPGECLTCHNPHLGKNRKLLTKDYKEVKHPVNGAQIKKRSVDE
jgi:predicted CXXCH cytochrome family protein